MSEMLANRYFIEREYERAIPLLEELLTVERDHSKARKKLIIAYTQTGRLSEGIDHFLIALGNDPRSIIDTEPSAEDCPCPTLCRTVEQRAAATGRPLSSYLILGILELYCDLERSRSYFQRAKPLAGEDKRIDKILDYLDKEKPACRNGN